MKLFTNKPNYVRLDDDVSFQVLRTNPKLTTNTKVMYDGKNIYMDSYSAAPILSTVNYKNYRVWKTGLFNRDIRTFLLGSNTAAYAVGQNVQNTIIPNEFDNQFETMYWCGVESINSKVYPQEMGCIAPLYLRKKLPNYFVIFKINNPVNTNRTDDNLDDGSNFYENIKENAKIIKTFDLREGTPIGEYIRRYVEQRDFKYDQSIYVNFSSNEIYYYGIDRMSGVLTQKVENFKEHLMDNDNTILRMDDWITSGFERNDLIFPYIINFEFLFDDNDIENYKFARYFGVYCNDIDLYDVDVVNSNSRFFDDDGVIILETNNETDNNFDTTTEDFFYVKDKYANMYSIKKNVLPNYINVFSKINKDDFMGFETTSVSAYVERVEGINKAMMVLKVSSKMDNGYEIKVRDSIYTSDNEIVTNEYSFTASTSINAGKYEGTNFSCKGSLEDIATAIAGVMKAYSESTLKWVTAYSSGNMVIIKSIHPGSHLNKIFNIEEDETNKIELITKQFDGGTDTNGCLFKIYTDDKDIFLNESDTSDRDTSRYLKRGRGRYNAKIRMVVPYINDDDKIDDTYSLLITDNNGVNVGVSKLNQVEIVDRFYAKIGVLSFFPVRDFDTDTVSSAYGNDDMMKNELDMLDTEIAWNDMGIGASDSDNYPLGYIRNNIKYDRFYHNNGSAVKSEYEYYFENIIPELTTVNKTVPTIAKWGYIDESKDSCENPYRLNTSKIFEACNFSANTFMQRGDIMEYTHSMPYYVNNIYGLDSDDNRENDNNSLRNEYQYIHVDESLWEESLKEDNFDGVYEKWKEYLSNTEGENPFEKLFGDTSRSEYNNKRFNKKYSRFLLGNDINRSSTLFRGVKFEITELLDGKEVRTGKYNDYKFSFIYVPVSESITESNSESSSRYSIIHFIKNDKYKFIVGLVLFGIKSSLEIREFNKAYVYAGSMGYIELNNNLNL